MIIPIPVGTTAEELVEMVPEVGRDIHAGYAVLDYLEPIWMSRIHIGVLNLQDCYKCLLGQIYGDYYDALVDHDFLSLLNPDQIAYLGFTLHNYEYDDLVGEEGLDRAWAGLTLLHEDALLVRRAVLNTK